MLKEEQRLGVAGNRVFRRVFGSKTEGMIGEWRKLHNEKLHSLYSSPIITVIKWRRMRVARHVEHMGRREAHKFWS
jgi:hypothetical protein